MARAVAADRKQQQGKEPSRQKVTSR
jgi:hypothetical protein